MATFKQQVALRIFGIHGIIIVLMVLIPMLKGCFKEKPPKEITTFIEIGGPPAAVEPTPVDSMPEPTPPDPTPEPVIPDPVVPEPVQKAVVPPPPKVKKKVEAPIKKPVEKPKPKPKEPEEPKQKLKKASEIKRQKRVPATKPTPTKKTPTTEQIRRMMGAGTSSSSSTSRSPSEFNSYLLAVRNRLYGAWSQPVSSSGLVCEVKISFQSNGRITGRTLVKSSGDKSFDQSVMNAVRSVSSLPPVPSGFPRNYVTVEFKTD